MSEAAMYDAIIVGARCAGAPTAMLLARMGHRILLVDKTRFPSDTISTHIIWPHGAEVLHRWGLWERLAATGCPPVALDMILDVGPFELRGAVQGANGGRGGLCPRRTVLDKLLVDAAVESGAGMREGFVVESLVWDGDRVVGIRGHDGSGGHVEERARVVIGADGVRSMVAKAVAAPEYDTKPVLAMYCYSYFSGFDAGDLEQHFREYQGVGCFPTHDGLTLVAAVWPSSRFEEIRVDLEGHFTSTCATAETVADRLRSARRETRWFATAGVANYFRRPWGPGWALVGDAGYDKDPITAQGISDAFIDADSLAGAFDAAWSGRCTFEDALTAHQSRRDQRVKPMYEFTLEQATLAPPPFEMQRLFEALRDNQDATNQFFSALTGSTPLPAFMDPRNLERILLDAGRGHALESA
jgi:2-polyprenyl-6-methoxyphenol hydroxylase-like FAD-dependent oxidoreductase